MAKNKSQNRRQSEHQQHDQRQNPGSDEHMTPGGNEAEERIMPPAPHSSRKGQKKFGHN